MPGLFDWWYRMRRGAGAPGAPTTRVAVPADPREARLAELHEVFAHVDSLAPELDEIARRSSIQAEAILTAGQEQIERIAADARVVAEVARAEAAATRRESSARDADEMRRNAESEAASVRARSHAAIPALVDDAVASVRAFAFDRSDET